MNHQTEKILDDAKRIVGDQGVFSDDQISILNGLIDKIGEAIDKEVDCAKSGPCCN